MDKRQILQDILSGKTPMSSAPLEGMLHVGTTDDNTTVIVNGEAVTILAAKKRIRRAARVIFWSSGNRRVPAELMSDNVHKVSFRRTRRYTVNNNE